MVQGFGMEGEHVHDGSCEDRSTTTGFLPLSLALGLFLMGLFVLGIVPGASCGSDSVPDASGKPSP